MSTHARASAANVGDGWPPQFPGANGDGGLDYDRPG